MSDDRSIDMFASDIASTHGAGTRKFEALMDEPSIVKGSRKAY